jgi:hypothetical protein
MVITLFSWYQRDESNQNSHGTDKRTEDVLLFILSLAFFFQPVAPHRRYTYE